MKIAALLVLACLGSPDDEVLVLKNVRVLPVSGAEIVSATIVIRGGKFVALGADVPVPEGAVVVDGRGLTAFPGLVQPLSRLGLKEGGAPSPSVQHLVYEEVNPTLELFGAAARSGTTTFGVQPGGNGFSGQGAALRPTGWTLEERTLEKAPFLRIVLQTGTSAKDLLRQGLEAGRKAIDSAKKSPAAKGDEKSQVLARFLKGELPAVVEVGQISELLHFWQVLEGFGDFKPRIAYAVPADAYKAVRELGERKARVILRQPMAFATYTRERINTAAELVRAGAEIALSPLGDGVEPAATALFRASELVKFGLSREAALRALTLAPAEMLGLEKRVGSIEVGKDADFLLFSADPLSPQARLREVYIQGRSVFQGD